MNDKGIGYIIAILDITLFIIFVIILFNTPSAVVGIKDLNTKLINETNSNVNSTFI